MPEFNFFFISNASIKTLVSLFCESDPTFACVCTRPCRRPFQRLSLAYNVHVAVCKYFLDQFHRRRHTSVSGLLSDSSRVPEASKHNICGIPIVVISFKSRVFVPIFLDVFYWCYVRVMY